MAAWECCRAGRVLSLAATVCSLVSCREVSASWPATTCSRPPVWFHVWNSSLRTESCSHSELFSPCALSSPLRKHSLHLEASGHLLLSPRQPPLFLMGKVFFIYFLNLFLCMQNEHINNYIGTFQSCHEGQVQTMVLVKVLQRNRANRISLSTSVQFSCSVVSDSATP